MTENYPEMPCGCCDAGTYSVTPVLNGLAMFGHCASQKEALKIAPRCQHEPKHICWGARDWIVSMQFPMSAQARQEIYDSCYR